MKKIAIPLLIIFLLLQLYLPGMAEQQIKEDLLTYFDGAEGLTVEVSTFPAWELFFQKQVDRVKIRADWIKVNHIRVDNFSGDYVNLSYQDGLIQGQNTKLDLTITEESLNNYVEQNYPSLGKFNINLIPEGVFLTGLINFFDSQIEINLNGSFEITEVNNISFLPGEFKIEKINVPVKLVKRLTGDLGFTLDLNQLKIPIQVEEINVKSDKLLLRGGNEPGKVE